MSLNSSNKELNAKYFLLMCAYFAQLRRTCLTVRIGLDISRVNKINVHPMLAYCWPIVYDHGSAVKQHWLKVLFLQGTPATQYPDTMLVQCWKSVIDDGTTFNQHWLSASQKEAVTSAERKYIPDLQVSKYVLLAALWHEETGRQLKSSKCLVYQGADIAF